MRLFPIVLFGLILSAAFIPLNVRAQSAFPDALPAVYAIQNAKIEIGDGRVIETGTVVIRDGFIDAVGVSVPVPPEAQLIKGDDLIVYPGFIDAHATKGLKLPDAQADQDTPPNSTSSAAPYMRAANRKGIRPELRASDALALTDDTISPMRTAGFTTVLFAPDGGMLSGTDALVNLSGKPKRESIVQSAVGLELGFQAKGDDYPGSLLGVFADLRQTFYDARYYQTLQTAFAQRLRPPPAIRRDARRASARALRNSPHRLRGELRERDSQKPETRR